VEASREEEVRCLGAVAEGVEGAAVDEAVEGKGVRAGRV
jgi:hypothetical protein